MPRGVYFSALRGGNLRSDQGKTVSGIPSFVLKTYEKNKQPGLKPGLAGDSAHKLNCSPVRKLLKSTTLTSFLRKHNTPLFAWRVLSCSGTAALLRAARADGPRRLAHQPVPRQPQPQLPADVGESRSRSTSPLVFLLPLGLQAFKH